MVTRVIVGAATGCVALVATSTLIQDEKADRNIIMPMMRFLIDGETAHKCGVWAAHHNLFPRSNYSPSDALKVKMAGLEFKTPVGLAAGFDKDAEGIEGMARTGFASIEIGSVTPEPQPGTFYSYLYFYSSYFVYKEMKSLEFLDSQKMKQSSIDMDSIAKVTRQSKETFKITYQERITRRSFWVLILEKTKHPQVPRMIILQELKSSQI